MVTSSKRAYASMRCLPGLLQLMSLTLRVDQPMTSLETPGHSQAGLTQSRGVPAPFSWVQVHTRFCLCPPRVSVSPVLWKFWNQIPLAFKVRFPGDSQSLCRIPRLGSLLWALELSQRYENFFGAIVLSLWVACSAALQWGEWQPLPRELKLRTVPPKTAAARAPVPEGRPPHEPQGSSAYSLCVPKAHSPPCHLGRRERSLPLLPGCLDHRADPSVCLPPVSCSLASCSPCLLLPLPLCPDCFAGAWVLPLSLPERPSPSG